MNKGREKELFGDGVWGGLIDCDWNLGKWVVWMEVDENGGCLYG